MPWTNEKRYDWFIRKFLTGNEFSDDPCPVPSAWDRVFIDQQVKQLPIRESYVLMCRLHSLTLNEICPSLRVTPERVRQIEGKAFRRCRGLGVKVNGEKKLSGRRRFYWWWRHWSHDIAMRFQASQQNVTWWPKETQNDETGESAEAPRQ